MFRPTLILGLLFTTVAAIAWQVKGGPVALRATSREQSVTPGASGKSFRLHNGWVLNPVGFHSRIADMPSLTALTPDGKHLIVGTEGYRGHMLYAFPTSPPPAETREGRDVNMRLEAAASISVPSIWRGMRFGPDGTLYVSGGPWGWFGGTDSMRRKAFARWTP